MKHLFVLLIAALTVYAIWQSTPTTSRERFMAFVTKHGTPVVVIVLVLFAGLVVAFYSRSFNLL